MEEEEVFASIKYSLLAFTSRTAVKEKIWLLVQSIIIFPVYAEN